MSPETILPGSRNATSSPASADGATPCALRDGLTIDLFGQAPAPASPSRSRASAKARKTNATSGLYLVGSSPSGDLQLCLENRLRARLGAYGSPEYELTWKHWPIESGPPICAQRASPRRIYDSAFTGWPTPAARDHFPAHKPEYIAAKMAEGHGMSNLNDVVQIRLMGWATPTAITDTGGAALCKWGGTGSRAKLREAVGDTVLNGALAPEFPLWLMGYPTAWARCAARVTPLSRKSRPSSSRPASKP